VIVPIIDIIDGIDGVLSYAVDVDHRLISGDGLSRGEKSWFNTTFNF
ncbi:unnamed protein product, partial [Rotaria sp. Silwood2]